MTSWQSQIDNDIDHSSVATRYANGSAELEAHLVDVHDHDGKVVGKLVPSAARAWDAMVAHAWRDGIDLRPTSSADTFRPRRVQDAIFADRYRKTDQGNGSRVCGGTRWYLRKGKATAACPGTSNHGKGEAVDVASCSGARLAWLEKHAGTYGFAWELKSEPWHLHYMLGDRVPAAVNDHEITHPSEEDDMAKLRLVICDPSRNEWPEIKGHWFKTDGVACTHVPTKGHATALMGLGLLAEDSPVAVSPNLLRELGAKPPA